MLRLRSCASSMMIVSYWRSSRSCWISASRMPSVISLTSVSSSDLVGEADLPADGLAERRVQLVGDALGDRARRDPAGLRVADDAVDAAAQLHADLRDLRRLAGSGLARDDHDLVVAYGREDLVLLLADGQLLRITERGQRLAAGRRPSVRTRPSRRRSRRGRLRAPRAYGSCGRRRVAVPAAAGRGAAARAGVHAVRRRTEDGDVEVGIPAPGSHLTESGCQPIPPSPYRRGW